MQIIALQGAFAEHQAMLQKISGKCHLEVIQVRTPEELKRCDGLIIPGGGQLSLSLHLHHRPGLTLSPESSTIALLARLSGLTEPLRAFVKTKSVWGTCAGAILLSQAVSNPKKGGQELLGGISVTTARNGWGSQVRHHAAFCVASVRGY
jgi:5'-phosphate synthase pdxT subunit